MKKYSILFMAIATILFISCSKDDDDNDYDDGTWDTIEITVDVTKVPMEVGPCGGSQPEEIHVTWGDGSSGSGLEDTYSHTYTTPGNYKITMKVRNMKIFTAWHYYSSIHFKDCSALEWIRCYSLGGSSKDTLTMPKTVKIENCPNLVDVNLSDQRVKNLEIENCPKINTIMCDNHKLSSLNLNLPLLEELDCSYGRTLKELDLSHLPALKTLNCSGNELSDIDLKKCSNLVELNCSYNQLTELNLGNCCELTELDCSNNKFTELDVSNNTKLKYLNCEYTSDVDKCNLETIWVWEGFDLKYWSVPEGVKFMKKQESNITNNESYNSNYFNTTSLLM